MSATTAVSDMLVTVKSRELQRAMAAEMHRDSQRAVKHFLATAHLEQVLADDYAQAGEPQLAQRALISAASCFWRGGQHAQARTLFDAVKSQDAACRSEIERIENELANQYPPTAA